MKERVIDNKVTADFSQHSSIWGCVSNASLPVQQTLKGKKNSTEAMTQ